MAVARVEHRDRLFTMSDGVMSDGEWWPAWHMLPKKTHLKHATRVYGTQSQRMQRAVRPHARIGDTQLNVAKAKAAAAAAGTARRSYERRVTDR